MWTWLKRRPNYTCKVCGGHRHIGGVLVMFGGKPAEWTDCLQCFVRLTGAKLTGFKGLAS